MAISQSERGSLIDLWSTFDPPGLDRHGSIRAWPESARDRCVYLWSKPHNVRSFEWRGRRADTGPGRACRPRSNQIGMGGIQADGPHPRSAPFDARLEGWPPVRPRLWPSFETRARACSSGRGRWMVSIHGRASWIRVADHDWRL